MGALLNPGTIAGLLSLFGAITSATGHPAAGAFISDPHTAEMVTNVASGIVALIAGILPGHPGLAPKS